MTMSQPSPSPEFVEADRLYEIAHAEWGAHADACPLGDSCIWKCGEGNRLYKRWRGLSRIAARLFRQDADANREWLLGRAEVAMTVKLSGERSR